MRDWLVVQLPDIYIRMLSQAVDHRVVILNASGSPCSVSCDNHNLTFRGVQAKIISSYSLPYVVNTLLDTDEILWTIDYSVL